MREQRWSFAIGLQLCLCFGDDGREGGEVDQCLEDGEKLGCVFGFIPEEQVQYLSLGPLLRFLLRFCFGIHSFDLEQLRRRDDLKESMNGGSGVA